MEGNVKNGRNCKKEMSTCLKKEIKLFKELFPGKRSHQRAVVLTCVWCYIRTVVIVAGTC